MAKEESYDLNVQISKEKLWIATKKKKKPYAISI